MLAVVVIMASSGCGDSNGDESEGSPTTSSRVVTQEVAAAVDAWAAAATPEAVCGLMTYAFKLGVAEGKDPAQCASWIVDALGPPDASKATIVSANEEQGQTAVRVTFSGGSTETTLYLVRECGQLKVNSTGQLRANPPPPPSC